MKHYRSACWVLLVLVLFIGTARFCHHQTQGFCLTKIRGNLLEKDSPIPPDASPFVSELLKQKFRYFARGKQSFAFLSEDGQYVVKIFNNSYPWKIQLWNQIAHLPFFKQWAKEKAGYFQNKLERTWLSYQIAFEEMQEETALCYVHLAKSTALPSSLFLIDRLNITHCVDPNAIGFVVQKKVDLVYPTLKNMIDQGNLEGAQSALSSLAHLFFSKYHRGIGDNDPLIRTNYGLLEGKAIQIDIGPLSKDPTLLSKERQMQEIEKTMSSLKFWLTKNCPSLLDPLDRELEELLLWEDEITENIF